MSTIIESIEQRQLRKDIPRFKAGDTVRVHFQVIEGQRRRVQVFEGIVIKRQGSGARETFTVRKQSFGVGVERTFPVHSPKIEKIEVGAIGDVNRAKLYYLREKIGKKARVRELRQTPAQLAAARAESEANQAALDAAEPKPRQPPRQRPQAEPEVEEAPAEPETVAEAEPVGGDADAREDAPAEEPVAEAAEDETRRGRDLRDRRAGCREGVAPPPGRAGAGRRRLWRGGSAAGSRARGGAGARARPRPRLGLRRRGCPLHRGSLALVSPGRDGSVHVRRSPEGGRLRLVRCRRRPRAEQGPGPAGGTRCRLHARFLITP